MKASIIILNWNGLYEDCAEAVRSALSQDWEWKEVIFVDNASSDDCFDRIKATFSNVATYRTIENLGCPNGRNFGARFADGDVLFFLENDGCYVDEYVVRRALDFLKSYSSIAALYMRVTGYSSNSIDKPLDSGVDISEGPSLSSSFRGGASAIRAEVFRICGGFPADFFRQGEERYLSFLIWDLGYKVAYWPEGIMRHKGSDYTGKAKIVRKETFKNDMITIVRLYPIALVWVVLPIKLIINLFRFSSAGVLSDFSDVMGFVSKNLFRSSSRLKMRTVFYVEALRRGAIKDRSIS